MTAARKTGLLRFSASRCLALIVKEWHQIGRDPSALVIGVFLPLFMLLVCGFGISMDMKDVPVAIVLEERTPVAQRIAVDFTANPYFDAKVFYAKAPAEKALEAREVECILTIPAGFAANAQQGEAAELGLTVYGVDSNSATLFKSYVLGQLNSSVTKMVSNGMIESAVASRVSAGPVKSLASRSWFNEASISTWYLVPGILVIVAIAFFGVVIQMLPGFNKLPVVFWVSLTAVIVSIPSFPGGVWIVEQTKHINFLATTTPILAYGGLCLGKDLEAFKRLSWRIVPVAMAVASGSFLCATALAELMLHLEGIF